MASPGGSLGGADIKGTLRVFGFGCTTGDEIAKVRIAQFAKLYPGVTLNCNESGWDIQKFTTALNSNEAPDLVHAPRNVVADLAAQGVIVPLDQCIASRNVDTSVFREAAMSQVTIGGKVYELPEFFNTRVVYINNKALTDAGLTEADVDTSDYAKLADLNTKLTKGKGGDLSRIGFDPKLPEFLPLWAKANGIDLASADGKTSQLGDPKIAEVLDALKPFYEASGGYTAFNDFRGTWDFFGSGNEFAKDQIGVMPFEQWYINVLADTSPDVDFMVKPFKARDGSDITWADGDGWAITSKAANADAACEFANVMTNAQTWITAAQARADTRAKDKKPNTGVYTGNKVADDVIFNQIVDLSAYPKFDAAVKTVLSVQDKAFSVPSIPGAAKFTQAWTDAVSQIISEGSDAAQTMQTANTEAQAAIDEVAGQ